MNTLTDYEIILLMNYIENFVGRRTAAQGGGSGNMSTMADEFGLFRECYGFPIGSPEAIQNKLHKQLMINRESPEDILA